MRLELKKVEYSERLSEETSCFCADVYADGKKLGTARNSGCGGATELRGDFGVLRAYAKTLPPDRLKLGDVHFDSQPTADSLVDAALHRHLCRKDMRRLLKKHALFTQGGAIYQSPLAGKSRVPEGCAILNDMPEDEALDIFMGGTA